jgi:hypothetical protein
MFDVFDELDLLHVVDTILTTLSDFSTIVYDAFGVELKVPFEWDIKTGPTLKEMTEYKGESVCQ